MTASDFTYRAFDIPEHMLQDIVVHEGSLTPLMHKHAGTLGDYETVKDWYKTLSREFNWGGATMMFNFVLEYFEKEREGNTRYRQMMIEKDGKPQGYLRMLHLSRDTATRREDCTKIEETIVSGGEHMRDLSLFRYMYNLAAQDARAHGKKRVITELSTGLSQQKYNGLARKIASLSKKSALSSDQKEALSRAKSLFNRDWTDVTKRFADAIGYEMTDIILPENMAGEAMPQIRISRTLTDDALPLPEYTAKNRTCISYKEESDLVVMKDYIATVRQRAACKYGLA